MKGILLVNLGSPDAPEKKAVQRYLNEFLMDERVIDVPYLLRLFLVKGIISPTRSKNSAEAYSKIWTDEGSPLIVNSEKLNDKVADKMDVPVELAMRYGSMSIEKGLQALNDKNVDDVLVIPLYPQFAMSTTETVLEKVEEVRKKQFPKMNVDHIPAFYNKEEYLSVLADQIKSEMETKNSHFLFSYHGLPERHIRKSDVTKSHCQLNDTCCFEDSPAHEFCYRHQSYTITEEMVKRLGIEKGNYSTTFQSRLGRDPWLQPYTDASLEELAKSGKTDVTVITPSFVSDCLETLEEMNMENRELFMESGGVKYRYIPCLNDRDEWVDVIVKWSQDWLKK